MPIIFLRVVCGLCVAIENFTFKKEFNKVDFPAFGFPIMLTYPDFIFINQFPFNFYSHKLNPFNGWLFASSHFLIGNIILFEATVKCTDG